MNDITILSLEQFQKKEYILTLPSASVLNICLSMDSAFLTGKYLKRSLQKKKKKAILMLLIQKPPLVTIKEITFKNSMKIKSKQQ